MRGRDGSLLSIFYSLARRDIHMVIDGIDWLNQTKRLFQHELCVCVGAELVSLFRRQSEVWGPH